MSNIKKGDPIKWTTSYRARTGIGLFVKRDMERYLVLTLGSSNVEEVKLSRLFTKVEKISELEWKMFLSKKNIDLIKEFKKVKKRREC